MPDPTIASVIPVLPQGPAGPAGPPGAGVDPGTTGTLAKYTGTSTVGDSLLKESTNVIEMYNSTNQQTFRVYGTRTDASNYRFAGLTMTTAGELQLRAEGLGTGATGNTFNLLLNGTTAMSVSAANTATFTGGMQMGAASTFQFAGRTRLTSPADGTLNLTNQAASGFTGLQANGTQVLTTRRTGWSAPTGTATRTSFATGSVTLPQLAEAVKALLDDLTTHGLIGA